MDYEVFKKEVERILLEKRKPLAWNEIRNASQILNQTIPNYKYVQKLRSEIGLLEIKDKKRGRTLWALRRWFKGGKQSFLMSPDKVTIVLLCKAKEQFSRKLGMLTHCTAGLDRNLKWKRLYPVDAELASNLIKWDIIEAGVQNFYPEKNRPESIKIWPSEVKKVGRIDDANERRKIIERVVETGEFLHRNLWKDKTLGLIKPKKPRFLIRNNEVYCKFFCEQKICRGHVMAVWDSEVVENRDFATYETADPYFLLGTHKYHSNKFLLISVINMSAPSQKRLIGR
jgi:hypothetical protein